MLSTLKKDKDRRVLVKKFEIKRLFVKVFQQDSFLKKSLESKAFSLDNFKNSEHLILQNKSKVALYSFLYKEISKAIPRNSSKTRVQNRCIKSGRSRAVLKFCKLSRIVLREQASKGLIPGVSKASW